MVGVKVTVGGRGVAVLVGGVVDDSVCVGVGEGGDIWEQAPEVMIPTRKNKRKINQRWLSVFILLPSPILYREWDYNAETDRRELIIQSV
jgi:hypothetical protein